MIDWRDIATRRAAQNARLVTRHQQLVALVEWALSEINAMTAYLEAEFEKAQELQERVPERPQFAEGEEGQGREE